MICSTCGGPLMPLGDLGALRHYRCRSCGAEASAPVPEPSVHRLDPADGVYVNESADEPVLAAWRCFCDGGDDWYDMAASEDTCRGCGASAPEGAS